MPNLPATVDLSGFSTWFENKQYILQEKIDDALNDPIFDLVGQDVSPNRATTIDVTGRDATYTGKTKSPGAKVSPLAPVEEDQLSREYVTFESAMRIEWESLQHDLYKFADEQPEELVDNVYRGISRLIHAQIFNRADQTTVTMPGSAGSYTLSLPDSKAFFATDHSGPNYSGKSNKIGNATTELSTPNVTVVQQHGIENFISSSGERKSFRANAIMVPDVAAMVEAALQITRSEKVRETANNSVNIYSGGTMDVIVLKYAPETPSSDHAYNSSLDDYWVLLNKEAFRKSVKYKLLVRPHVLTRFLDPENGDSYITVLARAAVYAKRWQCAVLSPSTTAPTHPGA